MQYKAFHNIPLELCLSDLAAWLPTCLTHLDLTFLESWYEWMISCIYGRLAKTAGWFTSPPSAWMDDWLNKLARWLNYWLTDCTEQIAEWSTTQHANRPSSWDKWLFFFISIFNFLFSFIWISTKLLQADMYMSCWQSNILRVQTCSRLDATMGWPPSILTDWLDWVFRLTSFQCDWSSSWLPDWLSERLTRGTHWLTFDCLS